MSTTEKNRSKRIKEYIMNRDGMICCYCDIPLSLEDITLDHIIPYSKGGTYNPTNLTIACYPCNNKRGNKSFFEFCKKFNFSEDKLNKYKRLFNGNLKIKVLNIAKEKHMVTDYAIPLELIAKSCQTLRINTMDFSEYESKYFFTIKFSELCERKRIKFTFEQLMGIIQSECE